MGLPDKNKLQLSKYFLDSSNAVNTIVDFLENFGPSASSFESVFNLGCGMILSVNPDHRDLFEKQAHELGLEPYLIGEVIEDKS